MASLSASSNTGAWLTLVGTLSTGTEWWSGLKRLDVGVDPLGVSVNYWTGGSSSSTYTSFPSQWQPGGVFTIEAARVGSQLIVYMNGSQVGALPDPGLFGSGQVYLGFNVAPDNALTVLGLSATMPVNSTTVSMFAPYLQVASRSGTGLRDLAQPLGLLVGAAVDPSLLANPNYAQALGREYSLIVPENAMKFAETEPAPHQFNFCQADQLVAFAQANGMKVRGHNLVWQQDLPAWLTNGNYSSSETASILQEHITTVVGHYKGQLIDWDVVNEGLAYSPPFGPQPSYWLTQLGNGYIDTAFQWAHAADPSAQLFYNDTGGEALGAKADAVYSLVAGMLARGVPINGVGLEMHLDLANAPDPESISANIERLGALGLKVHISEMDVSVPLPATAAELDAQASIYQGILSACLENSNCTAFLTWGVSDAHWYLPFSGEGAPGLLDAQFQPKPAYTSVENVLRSANGVIRPVIAPGGIVIHGGTATAVSPGALVDVYGTNLVAGSETAGLPLPLLLGGVQITVNGSAAPLYYVSPGMMIFQLPYSTPVGSALIQVSSAGVAGPAATVDVEIAAPSILTYGNNRAVVQNQDYSVNGPGNCALPETVAVAYLIGSGPLDNQIATGAPTPADPLARESLKTTATLGGVPATVIFAGMTPGLVGVMQLNLQVPNVSGDLPLQITVGNASSNSAFMCVGQ